MLKLKFENKMIDPSQEAEAEREASEFEANCHLIAISLLERELGVTHRSTDSHGAYNYQTGSAVFRDHLEAYKGVLRKGISTSLAAKQADAIVSIGLAGYENPWPTLPGVPLPEWLPKYADRARKLTETKEIELGAPCGRIEWSVRR